MERPEMNNTNKDEPVLRVEGICKAFNGTAILKSVSLSLNKGELKVLIGPSGGGKSTFLQCMNHLIEPDAGSHFLDGKEINTRSKRELYALRQQVGMIFQDFNLFDHLTAQDNVSIALRKVKHINKEDAQERARQELARVGLQDRAHHYPAELSGGQKQRVSIARALAMDPQVILLDEPTSALDPQLVGEVLNVIRDLRAAGMTMVMATHQVGFARTIADEIVFMQEGEIIEQGRPVDLLASGSGTRSLEFSNHLSDLQ
jgi:polar amino acid transport system ATP-binding protein